MARGDVDDNVRVRGRAERRGEPAPSQDARARALVCRLRRRCPGRDRGASPKYVAVFELDGEPSAYGIYRVKSEWEGGFPKGQVRVVEALAATAAAERELWRFLFGIDLTVRVDSRLDPASPLFLMVVDARSLQLRASEGLWLRLVDVEGALRGRSYATDDGVVIELSDEFCRWNTGRWRMGGDAGRTDE